MTSLHIIILRRLEKILNNKSEDRKNKKEAKSEGMKINMKEKFINLRKGLKLNQKQIAEYLDVDQSYISKIENGERPLTYEMAEKLCNLIGYDISYFFNNNEQESLNISFRTNQLNSDDLRALARVNEIALKLKEMKKLYKEIGNE